MNKQKAKKLGRKLNRELIEGEDLHGEDGSGNGVRRSK